MPVGAIDRRSTRQKAAIRAAFEQAGRPLSPQQVLTLAQSEVDKLGIATVYRSIKALVEEGWLSSVQLPGTLVYERAGKRHHHHFQCDRCCRWAIASWCEPDAVSR